jgi:tRNA1(Val) A37 N6-methylase TrmN6
MLYCFDNDKKIVSDIQKGNVDFIKLNDELKGEVHEQLKDIKINKKAYLPTLKELKTLKLKDKIFIPEKSEYKTIKGMWGRESKRQLVTEGWDMYEILSKDEERKQWRSKMYYRWKSLNDKNMTPDEIKERDENLKNTLHSVDLKLYILAKSKQARINDFISHLGKAIHLFESYESKLINLIRKEEFKKGKPLTEEEKIQIYKKEHNEEKNEILKFKLLGETKNERNKKNRLQQFFTGELLSEYVYQYSSIKKAQTHINILEPTAGVGALIKPIIKMINDKKLIDLNIDLVEIDIENRKSLLELQKKAPTIIKVLNQNNFLTFKTSTRYDYIFMNPPFHLRQNEDRNLRADVYDYDFITKAFGILKIGGELMCITGGSWLNNKQFIQWTQNKKILTFEYKVINEIETTTKDEAKRKREMLKFSGTKVNTTITVIKITKLSEEMDNEILSRRFYKSEGTLGDEIANGGISINKVFQTTPKVNKYKTNDDIDEIRQLEYELDNLMKTHKK